MRTAALSALLLLGIGFAGCGAGTDAAIDGINASITESATSHFPADCLRLHTLRLLEQTTKQRGRAAVRSCEEDALYGEGPTAKAVTITAVDVDGDRATANVAAAGADFDGQVLKYALVEDERWKIDQIVEFVQLDREQLILEIGRSAFEQAQRPSDADSASCIVSGLEGLDDDALEDLILDPSPDPLLEFWQRCLPRSAPA